MCNLKHWFLAVLLATLWFSWLLFCVYLFSTQVRSLPRHAVRVHSIKSLMPRQYLHRGGQETKAISFVWQKYRDNFSCVSAVVFSGGRMFAFWTFCLFLELSLFAPRLFCVFLVFVPVQCHFVSPEDVVSLRLLCVSWRLFPVLVVSFCSFLKAFLHLRRQCVSLWGCFESVCFFVVTLCVWGFVFSFVSLVCIFVSCWCCFRFPVCVCASLRLFSVFFVILFVFVMSFCVLF